jgi:hypothetical protein
LTDLFEEVEEQLRSDRYRTLARKVLPWALGVAALALAGALGYWGWDSYQSRNIAKGAESYHAAADAFASGNVNEARRLWTEAAKTPAKGYKALSLMQLGGLKIQENKPAEAVKLFDEAADAAPGPLIEDLARLKSAFAVLDTAPYKDVEARLKPLMEDGRPFRLQAREALAFAKISAGDLKGAQADLVVISQSLDASEGARARAQATIGLIESGSAKAVAQVVKAMNALPAPMTVPPGAVLGAPSAPPAQPQANGPQ